MRTPPVPRALRGALINTWPYRRLRDVALRAHRTNMAVTREDLARRYLSGTGIEIGALIKPLRVPPHVTVRQVDYKSRADLIRDDGPALRALGVDVKRIPEIDVVDDAATLATFADASVDFVIANHVLEHLEDPIAGLHTWLRVIRPGGTLLLTLPDARHTFDARRERTTVAHLERDHEQGPETSRQVHYEEWARFIECVPEDQVAARAAAFAREDARHHFHVWELEDFLELLRALPLPYELLDARAYGIEFSLVLRRV
jgi:SAM-dependent methyltransferase